MYSEFKTKKCRLLFNKAYSNLRDEFCRLDHYIARNLIHAYKNNIGDGTAVFRVAINNKTFVVKRYNASTFKLILKRIFFGNKALTSWKSAIQLNQNSIHSVTPVAMIQHYKYKLRSHAFFVSEYIEGMTAREYFATDSPMKNYWPQAIENIHTLTKQLKSKGFVHDDYQCANILMVDHQPYLLDLDHLRQYPTDSKAFQAEHQYDIEHFCRLLSYNPDVQEMFKERVVANST